MRAPARAQPRLHLGRLQLGRPRGVHRDARARQHLCHGALLAAGASALRAQSGERSAVGAAQHSKRGTACARASGPASGPGSGTGSGASGTAHCQRRCNCWRRAEHGTERARQGGRELRHRTAA